MPAKSSSKLRSTGIDVLGDLPWGTHFCLFYETKKDFLETIVPYFKMGLENNEFCLLILPESHTKAEALAALKKTVKNFDQYITNQSFKIFSHDEWYLDRGIFKLDRIINEWKENLDKALKRGYSGLRGMGDISWLSRDAWKDFAEYEKALDDLIANYKMIILCSYPVKSIRGDEILDAVRTHQYTVAKRHRKWEIVETPELKQAKTELKKLNKELEKKVRERTKQLALNIKQLKNSQKELRSLTKHIEHVREEERIRISREIHDELGQSLTALKMMVYSLENNLPSKEKRLKRKAKEISSLISKAIQKVGKIITQLRPEILDTLGLASAIEWHAREIAEHTGIKVSVKSVLSETEISKETTTAVFRIFQETLNNSVKHSKASAIKVNISSDKHYCRMEIEDDGVGFAQNENSLKKGFGIIGMKERVIMMNGEIKITSRKNKGTKVVLIIPCK
jgi:signal transduction histidine kinase